MFFLKTISKVGNKEKFLDMVCHLLVNLCIKPSFNFVLLIGVRGEELDSSSSTAAQQLTGASKYIGLTCVALLATIILIFVYLIVTRRRGHGSNSMSHRGISTLTHNGTLSGLPPGSYSKQ